MLTKLKTLFWYTKNPKLLPDILFKIKTKLFNNRRERTHNEALIWSQKVCQTPEEAFMKLFPGKKIYNLEKLFPKEYAYAIKQQQESPIKMGGPGCINLLYSICEAMNVKSAIETGVAYGWSSLAILLSLHNRAPGNLVSIDMPYPKMDNENFVGIVISPYLKEKWNLIRESDYTGLPKALNLFKEIDFCHYDSDKSYSGRMRSMKLIWNKLKKGGIFISDDISDNLGFKDFCEIKNIEPTVIAWNNKHIGIIIKNE
jgi:predicted O-methyltransferase YrrM